jgi:hypothetical protein
VTHEDPRSQLAEAYKELRTATLLASPISLRGRSS